MSLKHKEKKSMAKKVKEAYETGEPSENKEAEVASAELDESIAGDEAVANLKDKSHSKKKSLSGTEFEDLNALITELDRVSQSLEEQQQKSNEMQTRYLRAVADLENYRKRALKEKEELSKLVISNFVEDLLPVIDNFKLGMVSANSHPEAKVVADGLGMVLIQFMEVLKTKGVEEILPNGQEFDPQFEECVSHLPHSEVPENHVIETIRAGYKLKDRLIRAATVVVSSGKGK
jgi:molecular chaperone GrpE